MATGAVLLVALVYPIFRCLVTGRTVVLFRTGEQAMVEGGRFPCIGAMAHGTIALHACVERIGRTVVADGTVGSAIGREQGMVEFPRGLPFLRFMAGRACVRQALVQFVRGLRMAAVAIRQGGSRDQGVFEASLGEVRIATQVLTVAGNALQRTQGFVEWCRWFAP